MRKLIVLNMFLISSVLNTVQASEAKTTFVEVWKAGSHCSAVGKWKEVTKHADLDLPETKQRPMVWRKAPYIFVAEPTSKKAEAISNAWMLRDGRKYSIQIPLERGTTSEDLKGLQVCIYPEGNYFDVVIPNTDEDTANPRECELRMLYKFVEPEFKFVDKRCL